MNCKETKALRYQISNMRRLLESLVTEGEMTSEEVLKVSRELDELIVCYQSLMSIDKKI